MDIDTNWVPQVCTLPTVQRPLRLAEFDSLFTSALREQRRLTPTSLRWRLDPAADDTVLDLIRRESACCSFFAFRVTPTGETLDVEVHVPDTHVHILDALAARSAARLTA